jgi:hypothetical protein
MKRNRGVVRHLRGLLWSQTLYPIKGFEVMATNKIADFVAAVNSVLDDLMAKLSALYMPVLRAGETYSLAQARQRTGVAAKTLKAWAADGLPISRPPNTKKCFIKSDDLRDYLNRYRIDKTG